MKRTLLTLNLALASALASAPARADTVAISEEARSHFSAGVNFLQDPDGARYDDAYREFKAAYAASPSWKILGNLGIAAMKLERDGEAIEAFTNYLAQSGKDLDREERGQVDRDLKTLQAGVVSLSLSFVPTGALVKDERSPVSGSPVVNRYGPVMANESWGLRPGHHRLTVELDGYERGQWEFDAVPRQQLTHAFQLNPLPVAPPVGAAPERALQVAPIPSERSSGGALKTGSYVSFGVGVAGIALGTFSALTSKSKFHDANALCPAFPCDLTQAQADERTRLGKAGDSAKTLAAVGFVVGGVGIAAGVTLWLVSNKKPHEQKAAGASLALFMGPGLSGVRGTF